MSAPIYLNVMLLNKDEVVREKVKEKTGLKTGYFGKAVAYAANKVVTDETIINALALNLKEKLESAVLEMGISAIVSKMFQQGPFVVMKVVVTEIDQLTLILAAKGAEFASSFSSLLSTVSSLGMADSVLPKIQDKISNQVHEALMRKFGEIIPVKMAEAGLEVDCHVCAKEDQAEFFFDAVARLA